MAERATCPSKGSSDTKVCSSGIVLSLGALALMTATSQGERMISCFEILMLVCLICVDLFLFVSVHQPSNPIDVGARPGAVPHTLLQKDPRVSIGFYQHLILIVISLPLSKPPLQCRRWLC